MEDDDAIVLRDDAIAVLNEIFQQRLEAEFIDINNPAGKNLQFKENWQLSQFWYSNETKSLLTSAVLRLISEIGTQADCKIALLSCPSLYEPIKDKFEAVTLFEYDKRFSIYGKDFVYYDVNEGGNDQYLHDLHHQFDIIICDPPFLSKDCINKISNITKKLVKSNGKIIFCSGVVVESWVCAALSLKKCTFLPQHESNLCNEFASFANFDLDNYIYNN